MTETPIFVKCFRKASKAAEVLLAKRRALKNQESEYASALWEGYWFLEREAELCAAEAKKRGQLLFLGGRA
jgi:hypothetical protein